MSPLKYVGVLAFSLFLLGGCTRSGNERERSSGHAGILSQGASSRKMVDVSLPILCRLDFAEIDPPLFRPTCIQADDAGSAYTLSWRNFLIYKFEFDKDGNFEKVSAFGKGRGQGPGELSQPMDMKVRNGKIYISDLNTGSIEVYTTSGLYLKRLTYRDHDQEISPIRIVPIESGIVMQTYRFDKDKLFFVGDETGRAIRNFGNNYDNSMNSLVLLDGITSNACARGRFYFFPLYLGYVCVYNDRGLVFMKETIDGVRYVNDGEPDVRVEEKAKTYWTASSAAIGASFMIVATWERIDKTNRKSNWDIYRTSDFRYLFSIPNHPQVLEMAICGNRLICLDKESLTVFRLDEVISRVKPMNSGNM